MMDIPHLTEDEMSEIKKEVLIKLRNYLTEKIIADRHFDYLRSRRILTKDDAEEIGCRCIQKQKAGRLLDILAENPRGLDALIESIQLNRTQNFIIDKITDEMQRVKNERIEALRAGASSSSVGCSPVTGATTDLSRTLSHESNLLSTILVHPDGEGSPSTSDVLGSLNPPARAASPFAGGGSVAVSSSVASSSSALPKPGDPGAPALPEELLLAEAAASMDAGAQSASSGGDGVFQPLRSRSIAPTSHRDIFPSPSYTSR